MPLQAGAAGLVKGEPVYRLRVRGTEDLELAYEIVQPDGTADTLSTGFRRRIGLVRLGGDDRTCVFFTFPISAAVNRDL
jgi:hypothetical protein